MLQESLPLGYTTGGDYHEEEFDLASGDVLLLMSDGLPERLNGNDELLGYEKMVEAFRSVAGARSRGP